MEQIHLQASLYFGEQSHRDACRKLLFDSFNKSPWAVSGNIFARTLSSLLHFTESTKFKQSQEHTTYRHVISKSGIECNVECVERKEESSSLIIAIQISFPSLSAKLNFADLPPDLFSFKDGKWEVEEHEWQKITLDLGIANKDEFFSTSQKIFLPSPIYHLLSELLRNSPNPPPPLQANLIQSKLSELRKGNSQEIGFFNDSVLNSILRDLLLPFTHLSSSLSSSSSSSSSPIPSLSLSPSLSSSSHSSPPPSSYLSSSPSPALSPSLTPIPGAIFNNKINNNNNNFKKALFHGPSGSGKTKIARFIFSDLGFRPLFFGTPTHLNYSHDSIEKLKSDLLAKVQYFPSIPHVFVLDECDISAPPLGDISLIYNLLSTPPFQNVLLIATALRLPSGSNNDRIFRGSRDNVKIYFSPPSPPIKTEILSLSLSLHGFHRCSSFLRAPLSEYYSSRIHQLLCSRTGGQIISLGEACVRQCVLDMNGDKGKQKEKEKEKEDPEWEYVFSRLERVERDFIFSYEDPDITSWNSGDAIPPPSGFDELVVGGTGTGEKDREKEKIQLTGRILCDVDAGKLLIECKDNSVYPLWFPSSLRGPAISQQVALGLGATLLSPATVMVIDSRRKELMKGPKETEEGFATLLKDAKHAGMNGGAVVVIDVDDLVGIIKDASRERQFHRYPYFQGPFHKFDSTKILRENIMREILSFASFAAFVKDVAEKNYCIVVAVASDTFVAERIAAAWQAYFPLPLETVFYPKSLRVSHNTIVTDVDDEDASGCVCAQMEIPKGESFLWIVQTFLTNGSISLGVVHNSINTLVGQFLNGIVGDEFGSWGFRITPACVEVCQPTGLTGKGILSPLPEAHENPTRVTIRNHRAVFGVFLQFTPSGYKLHLLRLHHSPDSEVQSSKRRWEHVAFKRIENLEGLIPVPIFGLSKKATSVVILECMRVPANFIVSDALPDSYFNPSFVLALRNPSTVALYKGGFHLSIFCVFTDKTKIHAGKKAIVKFNIHEKAPQFVIGFVKESDFVNVTTLTWHHILGFNPNYARCYVGQENVRELPSLKEDIRTSGYLYIDLCPTSPYFGSVHYFKIRFLGNLVYSGSLIEGINNEAYRVAISFDDSIMNLGSDQGKALGTLGTPKIGAGLGRECLPMYVPEWYPIDYSIPQGSNSFSPDPNTMRQETNGMNSRFTKELSPQNVDWHYVECRVNSFTGSAQVYLGFAPRDDVATFGNLHVGYKGTSGFGVAVYNSEVYLGNSGVTRANTKLSPIPNNYVRIGLLLSVKSGEVHIFWSEIGVPGPLEYKGLLFENVKKDNYRFVISASTAGTTITWRGFNCNGTIAQAKAHVQSRVLEFNEITGSVAYASKNYVIFPGMDIIGDDVLVMPNASSRHLRQEVTRIGAGAFNSSGAIKDYMKIYQRMRIVDNRVEIAGLSGPVCSDFCLRVHIHGYVFIPQHDSLGEEQATDGGDLLAVAQKCTQDNLAVGFNTGGFLKYSLKNWSLYLADPGASGCFSGIFVKESLMCLHFGTTDPKECLNIVRSFVSESQYGFPDKQQPRWSISIN